MARAMLAARPPATEIRIIANDRRPLGPHGRARPVLRFAQGKACAGAGRANGQSTRVPRLAASLTQQSGWRRHSQASRKRSAFASAVPSKRRSENRHPVQRHRREASAITWATLDVPLV